MRLNQPVHQKLTTITLSCLGPVIQYDSKGDLGLQRRVSSSYIHKLHRVLNVFLWLHCNRIVLHHIHLHLVLACASSVCIISIWSHSFMPSLFCFFKHFRQQSTTSYPVHNNVSCLWNGLHLCSMLPWPPLEGVWQGIYTCTFMWWSAIWLQFDHKKIHFNCRCKGHLSCRRHELQQWNDGGLVQPRGKQESQCKLVLWRHPNKLDRRKLMFCVFVLFFSENNTI